jgi:hypothetical protein
LFLGPAQAEHAIAELLAIIIAKEFMRQPFLAAAELLYALLSGGVLPRWARLGLGHRAFTSVVRVPRCSRTCGAISFLSSLIIQMCLP